MSDLTNTPINLTYTGVLHSDGPLTNAGLSLIYDGVGNESSISIGRTGQGASITGTLNVDGNINSSGSVNGNSLNCGAFSGGAIGEGGTVFGDLTVTGTLNLNGALKAGNVNYPTSVSDTSIFSLIYPIGSIYLSVNDTNPSTYWPGTAWIQVSQGRYLAGVGTTTGSSSVTFTSGDNSGSFQEIYNLGMVDHIHGVGTMTGTFNDDGAFITRSWTSNTTNTTRGINGDGGGGYSTVTPQTFANGLVTSSPLDPITALPLSQTDTIDIKPPSFAMYVWQRIG